MKRTFAKSWSKAQIIKQLAREEGYTEVVMHWRADGMSEDEMIARLEARAERRRTFVPPADGSPGPKSLARLFC